MRLLQGGAQSVGVVVQGAVDEFDLEAGIDALDLVAEDLAGDDLRAVVHALYSRGDFHPSSILRSHTATAGACMVTDREGFVQVYTGDGKGKTTASLGLVLRALGQGLRPAVLQFMKSDPTWGEIVTLRKLGCAGRAVRPGPLGAQG